MEKRYTFFLPTTRTHTHFLTFSLQHESVNENANEQLMPKFCEVHFLCSKAEMGCRANSGVCILTLNRLRLRYVRMAILVCKSRPNYPTEATAKNGFQKQRLDEQLNQHAGGEERRSLGQTTRSPVCQTRFRCNVWKSNTSLCELHK